MKILILGGTRFLGRHLVSVAGARGHHVTLFNRGSQPAPNAPGVETIVGDRDRDLAKLRGRSWDAVIDSSGYLPRSVRASAESLVHAVDRYVYVSSVSAYADLSTEGVDETAPLSTLTIEQLNAAEALDTSGSVSAVTFGSAYGGLKALCESTVESIFSDRALIIRAGLLVGPHDYTDRFTYWPVRTARGGEVLAPGRPDRFVQFLDARDLAEWIVDLLERQQTGVFNAASPPNQTTMAAVLETCRSVSNSNAHFTWVPDRFLIDAGVRGWSEMPLWLPEQSAPHSRGLMAINTRKAAAAGLRCRPLDVTVADVLRWYHQDEQNRPLRAGLPADKEAYLLRQWRSPQ